MPKFPKAGEIFTLPNNKEIRILRRIGDFHYEVEERSIKVRVRKKIIPFQYLVDEMSKGM